MSKITVTFDGLTEVIKQEVDKAIATRLDATATIGELSHTVEDLAKKIDKLNHYMDTIRENMSALEDKLIDYKHDTEEGIHALEISTISVEDLDVDKLNETLKTMDESISDLEYDLEEAKDDIRSLENQDIDDIICEWVGDHLPKMIEDEIDDSKFLENFDIHEYASEIIDMTTSYISEHLSIRTEWDIE